MYCEMSSGSVLVWFVSVLGRLDIVYYTRIVLFVVLSE